MGVISATPPSGQTWREPGRSGNRGTICRPFRDYDCGECGKAPLDDWLKLTAHNAENRTARTYVVCEGNRVVGYYCILSGSVELKSAPRTLRKQAPSQLPVSILGRLAVDQSLQGQGLGPDLLRDALSRIVQASEIIGIRAVLVHALDDDALAFYQSQAEFIVFPEGSRTLFLPLETIISGL